MRRRRPDGSATGRRRDVSLLLWIACAGALGALQLSALPPALRGAVTIGFPDVCTTFSTFSFETIELVQDGR